MKLTENNNALVLEISNPLKQIDKLHALDAILPSIMFSDVLRAHRLFDVNLYNESIDALLDFEQQDETLLSSAVQTVLKEKRTQHLFDVDTRMCRNDSAFAPTARIDLNSDKTNLTITINVPAGNEAENMYDRIKKTVLFLFCSYGSTELTAEKSLERA